MSGRESSPDESWVPDDESELPVPEGELIDGKYSVERIFASGGMGIVCLGRHVQLNQPVAIKFLRRALSGRPSIVERFLNEARALAALRSEHVVRVMDVGQLASGRPYLVMEHLEGIHLDALLERDGPLSIETAIKYTVQVCEPLAEAHALGIVHRDIKPENLFLWSGGPTADRVKVLDFGLAKQLGSSRALGITGPQDSIGSPSYMSPEQITTPHLVDSRTDIWSLGVVLYRLLTGTLPFDGQSLVEVLSHILNAAPRPLAEVRPSLDADLDAIVARCLSKSPDGRFETMAQLADALNAYLAERHGLQPEVMSDGARSAPPSQPPASDAELRIAGVRSRWPAVLIALAVLIGVGVYFVAKNGGLPNLARQRLQESDAPLPLRANDERWWPSPRGVFGAQPVSGGRARLTLPAVPERDKLAREPAPPEQAAPVTDTERATRAPADHDSKKEEPPPSNEQPVAPVEPTPPPSPDAAKPDELQDGKPMEGDQP
jgi:serine/threonine protein kinase